MKSIESTIRPIAMIFGTLLLGMVLAACEEEGPAEQLGSKIDEAVEEAGDKVKEAADELEKKTD